MLQVLEMTPEIFWNSGLNFEGTYAVCSKSSMKRISSYDFVLIFEENVSGNYMPKTQKAV